METVRGKDAAEDRSESEITSGKKSPEKKISKRQKAPSRKFPKSKGSRGDNSVAKNDLRNNSGTASAPQNSTVSSDIRTKKKFDKDEMTEKEKRPAKVVEVKSEGEQVKKVESVENEASGSSSESSSSDSTSRDSSSSSAAQKTRNIRGVRRSQKKLPVEDKWEIITLDDSEDSICEIPVPPKPEPPTINLDDSEDSICEIPVPPKPRPPIINLDDSESSTSSDRNSSMEINPFQRFAQSLGLSEAELRKEWARQSREAETNPHYLAVIDRANKRNKSQEDNSHIIAASLLILMLAIITIIYIA